MEWSDDGIVLSARKHGEASVIASLLTRGHGRHAGLVRGGAGKRLRGVLQPGNLVHATWRARLAEHLGNYVCELREAHAARVLDDPERLAGLSAACAVAEAALPEREPHGPVYDGLSALLGVIDDPDWPSAYVKWELGLLAELGFGLDLESCAATGSTEELAFVSPKSGRAVSRDGGVAYQHLLLPLPEFLLRPGGRGDRAAVADGLRLTGFFLGRHAIAPKGPARGPSAEAGDPLPPARRRLEARFARQAR